MAHYAMCIATIFINLQSLFFFPRIVPRVEDQPTQIEIRQARQTAYLFLRRLEETGDFARVIDELFVEDFIERYVQEQRREVEESGSSGNFAFAAGIECKRDLLDQATADDWRRLYIATYNFFYHTFVLGLNAEADNLLSGREPDDDVFENLIPQNVFALFNNHPMLKNFLDTGSKPKADEPAEESEAKTPDTPKEREPNVIKTPADIRGVTATLEEGLRLLLEEQGNRSLKLTDQAKRSLAEMEQTVQAKPAVEISEKEYSGYPPGTRIMVVPTSIFLELRLVEVNGRQKIIWADLFSGI